jgi:hypothetical protein
MSDEYRSMGQPPEVVPAVVDSGVDQRIAQDMLSGPVMGLLAVAGVGIFIQLIGLAINLLGAGVGAVSGESGEEKLQAMASGVGGIIGGIIGIAMGALIIYGAMKMKKLENYGLAMAVAVIAMLPCISPCCVIGLPVGIWALTVLVKPEVKSAFR